MPDENKSAVPARAPDKPPQVQVSSKLRRHKYEEMGIHKLNTEGTADKALLFAKRVWITTVMVVAGIVSAYFIIHPTATAFTETVLGIIVAGIVSCGFGFKVVYNIH